MLKNQKKVIKREWMTVHEDALLMTLGAVQSAGMTATTSDPTTIISTRTEIRTESSEEYSPCPFCWKSLRNKGAAPEPKFSETQQRSGDFTAPSQRQT